MPTLTNSSFRENRRCASGLLEAGFRLPRCAGPCAADAAATQNALMEKPACAFKYERCRRCVTPQSVVLILSSTTQIWEFKDQGTSEHAVLQILVNSMPTFTCA